MLKLKSVVKNRQQLLATGWVEGRPSIFYNEGVAGGYIYVRPGMFGGVYNGVVKDPIVSCVLEGCEDRWEVHPEMVLTVDQWGFVRERVTLLVLLWDGIHGNWVYLKTIEDDQEHYPILVGNGTYTDIYMRTGQRSEELLPSLSKYPCNIEHGGYIAFNFDELKEAFNCPKVLKEPDDSNQSTSLPNSYEYTPASPDENQVGGLFGEKTLDFHNEISSIERVVGVLERLDKLRSSDMPGLKERAEEVMVGLMSKV